MTAVDIYIKALNRNYKKGAGNSTEHSHRGALQNLIKALHPIIHTTNEPKAIACGAPDISVTRTAGVGDSLIGFVETKDIGVDLDQAQKSEQLQRYREALPNLILTDYLEFRHYIDGDLVRTIQLAERDKAGQIGIIDAERENFVFLLTTFVDATDKAPAIAKGRDLARVLAAISRQMKVTILAALHQENVHKHSVTYPHSLTNQLQAFREVLIPDLEEEDFADVYAQTVAYGMFSARFIEPKEQTFTRQYATFHMPANNPFLARTFARMGGAELDERLEYAADTLAAVLNRTDMAAILREFHSHGRRDDPIVYFYENFLAEYDPALREARGVYYTPGPVVSYIVRSVDKLLKSHFGLTQGLADQSDVALEDGSTLPKVQLLDPACGTGTFLRHVIDFLAEGPFKTNKGLWPVFVRERLLRQLHGFEFLMAPYTLAHLKVGMKLQETGFDLKAGERLRIYLTNTLEEPHALDKPLPFTQWLADEAAAASAVKRDKPVMVVLGNPPYSGHSANPSERAVDIPQNEFVQSYLAKTRRPKSTRTKKARKAVTQRTFIGHLLHGWDPIEARETGSYFHLGDQPLGEKNPKWLNDDYVKFIRFSQWRIERTGHGVLAFITNHGYLDNPTFRALRLSLMETFDDIYILDLHGSLKKKEVSPDGSRDENVFDIQAGVAICLCVKRPEVQTGLANVHHAELWGPRGANRDGHSAETGKYPWLAAHDVENTPWQELEPAAPSYLFVPRDVLLEEEYSALWSLPEVCRINSVGIVTARDKLAVHFTEAELRDTIETFRDLDPEEAREQFDLGDDARDWKVDLAQKDLRHYPDFARHHTRLLYRPFDARHTYYTGQSRGFICMPRPEVMGHMREENLGICIGRSGSVHGNIPWDILFTTSTLSDFNLYRRGGHVLFPLYLYPSAQEGRLDLEGRGPGKQGRRANLDPAFVAEAVAKTGLTWLEDGRGDLVESFGPEDLFAYIYAVLHAPGYRSRYADFLKRDFPRLPLTAKRDLFVALAHKGHRLMDLHLMRESSAPHPSRRAAAAKASFETHLRRSSG